MPQKKHKPEEIVAKHADAPEGLCCNIWPEGENFALRETRAGAGPIGWKSHRSLRACQPFQRASIPVQMPVLGHRTGSVERRRRVRTPNRA
ncbi:hypothetical protein [Aureimonas psammosilenae]|uniref:hypothetical protein n=1 Tax=Aureimonas psammosilenae TaxID=2495496 RepID=UPI001260A186|nr:hypothetical protein [Aureimonas psammosilenae]